MSVVDWVSVAEVLAAGEVFGEDNPIPGHHLERPVPDLDVPPPESEFSGTAVEALDAIDALVRDVLAEVPSEWELALGLSGGRDSRHLLLAAQAVDRPIGQFVTAQHWNPGASQADTQGARALAEELGLPLEIVPGGQDRYAAEWEKNRRLGLRTLNHSWLLPMADHLAGQRALLDGLNGGALLGRDSLTRSWLESHGSRAPTSGEALDHIVRRLVRGPRRRITSWLPSSRIDSRVWKEVEERLRQRFERYTDYPNPFQAWSYLEHARRGTALAPYGLMGNDRVICPYFDPRVVALGLSLPWAISSRPNLQVDMISRIYPQVAHVPYANDLEVGEHALTVDADAENVSWSRISRIIQGHVSEDTMRQVELGRGWHGNRRIVMVAQALAWEEVGHAATLVEV